MKQGLELRLLEEISITSDTQMTRSIWKNLKKKKKKLKSVLRKEKEESGKGDLKLNIQNENHGIQPHHFMAKLWGNNGNSEKFYVGGSKITADGDSGLEIKMCFLLRRKVMTRLDNIF